MIERSNHYIRALDSAAIATGTPTLVAMSSVHFPADAKYSVVWIQDGLSLIDIGFQ